jgi:hypothetical protein
MIRVTCPNCGSKLNAKDELAGQTRKCPKCAQPVRIVTDADGQSEQPIPIDPTASDQHIHAATEGHLPSQHLPERLNREHHYLICDKTHLVATWENNGHGWMLRTGAGFISAKRNHDKLPSQGDFKLIELKFDLTPEGKRLTGVTAYQLAPRWALTTLDQGDDLVLDKIAGHGFLNRDQKYVVRHALKDQFMRQVWENSTAVLDYLGNTDYHSSGVG